jgi:LmbE family N-acetylglucosaminyl deacetylase
VTRHRTLVAFHAHPDDETLLTGGTLARAAAEGHRVVLVVATLGQAGLAVDHPGDAMAARRRTELLAAATALGCARVESLGYLDSGLHGDYQPADGTGPQGGPQPVDGTGRRFSDVPVDEAAARLAAVLDEEHADVLTSYDPRGGYGHPDHVQVHHVGALAAELAGTPRVLQATVDRRALRPALAVARLAGRWLPSPPLDGAIFTPHEDLTHAVDVRAYLRQKRAALRAHTSQTEGGRGPRTLAVLSRLPAPLFAAVAGREWFIEAGRVPGPTLADDIFAGPH